MNGCHAAHSETVTIDDLGETDRRLGIQCCDCNRFRYMRPHRYAGETKVASIANKLKCAQCGSDNVCTFPVERHPSTGYWPAECS